MVGSRTPLEALLEAKGPLVPAQGHKGSIGIYGNGRKRMQTDGNKLKPKPDQRSKSNVKAKTYD